MMTVSDLLREKGTAVWAVRPDATVFEALELMAEKNIGAVLVLDDGRLVGIMSERDYARRVILMGKSSRETAVSEIMTARVLCVRVRQTVAECMALMTEKRVRHLPVLDDAGHLAGLVSIGDVVKAVIAQQEFTITNLERYITGAGISSYPAFPSY
ncbi:MAG TPA: CBS domain-containing protein [Anaerolineae bacterium]|nr:CBS domain-containing protein [Anaerolineae bacterium]HNU04244.1 CBS domain-containing protein [Anaerolineae bacterium]